MIHIWEKKPNTEPKSRDSSTLKKKSESRKVNTKMSSKNKPIFIAKYFIISKAREGKSVCGKGTGNARVRRSQQKEAGSAMFVSTPLN